ncbi:DedA family protein [Inquilinus sp. CAU 1745]|uniref:DedA family protein n=1 Tax=Inquilinus sp. CAU 1745 TaxID=3140369 RepID=UPI00325B9740
MFDWITAAVEQTGYLGIAFLMLLENLFPPIPSELIMPLAGFVAASGDLNIFLVVLAGAVGSVLGALFWFYIGRLLGRERMKRFVARHGRWFTMTPEEVEEAFAWFDRHRGKAVFFGRLLPSIRTLISVPAGIARMPLIPFLLYTTIGTALWTAFLAAAGYLLESQYHRVEEYVNPVSNFVLIAVVVIYAWRALTFGRRSRRASAR